MVANLSHQYRTTVDPSASNNPHSYALELVGGGHRVLEVGCSTGHVTKHLVAAGNTVVGVEIDESAAVEARQVTDIVHVIDLDMTKLSSIEHGEFDVILLGDVLEHVRNPPAVLGDIVTLLAPAGRLVVSVPNAAHVDVRLMLLEGRVEYQDDGLLDRTHLRWFTKASFRELLDGCGFMATDMRRVIFPLGGSNVPFDPSAHSDATIDFILSDPDALSYQYVVECRPRSETGDAPDVLAPLEWPWPTHSCDATADELAELRVRTAQLQAEVDSWENSTVAKLTKPLRAASGKLRRALASHK
jgi:SAM-dependent methyltransferase